MIDDAPKFMLDQVYSTDQLSFRYPGYWQIDEQKTDDSLSVTITTEEGSFWMLSMHDGTEEPADIIQSAIEAFTDEYEQIDVYEREDQPSLGWSKQELEFECSDFIVIAILQAVQIPGSTLLLLMQGQDEEFETYRDTFQAITNSLIQAPKSE
ncbi:MAG: hypothetical protein JKY95_11395 [Planctomycetaceae bacterium]|nr:hypothetical protein [Planctomycetaceae bacterium]